MVGFGFDEMEIFCFVFVDGVIFEILLMVDGLFDGVYVGSICEIFVENVGSVLL